MSKHRNRNKHNNNINSNNDINNKSYIYISEGIPIYRMDISDFYNPYTLNIFSDASMKNTKNGKDYECYGAICVCQDRIIDHFYIPVEHESINHCEISGVRLALSFADKYKFQFKNINIFSDSLFSIKGLTEYIYTWKFDESVNSLRSTSSNKIVSQQSIFIECKNILDNIYLCNPNIKLYHQSGHVSNTEDSIIQAAEKFREFNDFYGLIDINFIAYISKYNNKIDKTTRSYLNLIDLENECCTQPILFFPTSEIR